MDTVHSFYIKQYRKDMIDKLNVVKVSELDLSFSLKVSSRIKLPSDYQCKRHELLFIRGLFEFFCGQSAALRKISLRNKLTKVEKLSEDTFNYEYYCNIHRTQNIFNLLSFLFYIVNIFRFTNFKISFHQIENHEYCVLKKLKFRYVSWFVFENPIRNNHFRISFQQKKRNSNRKRVQHLLRVFLYRVRICKRARRVRRIGPHII